MSWVLTRPGSVSRARRPTRRAGHHRVPGALALVALWATAAAELSVCSDPSDRMMIVWIFFGSEECDAGNDGALSAGGGTAGGGAEVASAIGTAGRRVPGLEDGGS
jgi:hypothetical protein